MVAMPLDTLKKSSKQICMDLFETFLFLSKHTVNLELDSLQFIKEIKMVDFMLNI